MQKPTRSALLAAGLLAGLCLALQAQNSSYLGLPAIQLENGVVELQILTTGGPFARFTLKDDPEHLSPLWAPLQAAADAGQPVRAGGSTGHFVCVDGFGGVSQEERAAGLSNHGEAHALPWKTVSQGTSGGVTSLVQSVELPIVQEGYQRTVRLVEGENVVYVHSELTNHLGFDRPINWAEHATIGSPFLERGATVVDMSKNRAMTRPYDVNAPNSGRRTLTSGEDFEWPMGPLRAGGKINLRTAPVEDVSSLNHTGHLMTLGGEWAWVTALHPGKRLLLGYIYNTTEYPWMQIWQNYPTEGMMARGMEFGTQTFDVPRRQVMTEGKRWDTQLFRVLPAKSTITTDFVMFLVRTPEGFTGVSDVKMDRGRITIRDAGSSRTVTLAASLAPQ